MDKAIQYVMIKTLAALLKQIDPEDVKEYCDSGLDIIEDKYNDNKLVQAGCKFIRQVASIPDND